MTMLDMVVALDRDIALLLNGWATQASTANRLIVLISGNNAVKMAPFLFIAAFYWNVAPVAANRRIVINGLIGIFVAFFIGRFLQVSLPFRARPIHDPAIDLHLAAGLAPDTLGGWSSFPSDHGAIFAALIGLAFALSRPVGVLATLHTLILVLGVRVYIGVHYLSDVLGGMAIGLLTAAIMQCPPVQRRFAPGLEALEARYPALFYGCAVVFLAELMDMFDDVREFASVAKAMLQGNF